MEKKKNKNWIYTIVIMTIILIVFFCGVMESKYFDKKEINVRNKIINQLGNSICNNYDMEYENINYDGTLYCKQKTQSTLILHSENNYQTEYNKKYIVLDNENKYNGLYIKE